MLWDKGIDPADWMTRYTVGEDYKWDMLLLPYDVAGTRGHAEGLQEIGILSEDDVSAIHSALDALLVDFEAGNVVIRPEDEDCHTVIEAYLTAKLGDIGKRIHTGRSRNDQVLTALRLYLKDALKQCAEQSAQMAQHLINQADSHAGWLMPGYTHLQQAMPSTVGLWAMGYAELALSDCLAMQQAYAQVDTSPLGSAAGYGVPHLALPRAANAQRLGFARLQQNVTATQLSRGKIELHVCHALLQVGHTLNRLASELVMYNMSEFGFVALPPDLCTGSSIMPQKQNPDVLELTRAYYHRLLAEMNVLMTLPANLPSGYHRDLQLTKEAVMRAVLLAQDMLSAMNALLPQLGFRKDKLDAALKPELLATAAAIEKVNAGLPFRDAYREAAREVDLLDAVDAPSVLASYLERGYPGQHVSEPFEKMANDVLAWARSAH